MQSGKATVANSEGLGKHAVQLFRNLFGSAELRKIIVYDGNSHFTLHHA